MQTVRVELTSRELSLLLYALRAPAFKDDSKSIQEETEAVRKRLVTVLQEAMRKPDVE